MPMFSRHRWSMRPTSNSPRLEGDDWIEMKEPIAESVSRQPTPTPTDQVMLDKPQQQQQSVGLGMQSASGRDEATDEFRDRDNSRLSLWLPEILSQLGGMACLTGIVILLWHYDGKAPPEFGKGFTLNTLLAFLTSMARACFLVPIVEGISQLKWVWFSSRKHRPLVDFQRFDDAARGAIGGLKLLFSFNGFLASFGALIMLSGLVTSTLTQQAITYILVQDVSHEIGDVATVQRATVFSTYDGSDLAVAAYDTARLQRAIFDGTFSPPTEGVPHVRPVCSSGECTWPPYGSLAICGGVANLTARGDTKLLSTLGNLTEKRWAVLSSTSQALFSALGYEDLYLKSVPRIFPIVIGHLDNPTGAFNQSVVDLMVNDNFIAYSDELVNNTVDAVPGRFDMSKMKYLEVALWWCTKTYQTRVTAGEAYTEELSTLTQPAAPPSVSEKQNLIIQWEPNYYLCYQAGTCNTSYAGTNVHLVPPPGSVEQTTGATYPVHQWTALTASALITATMFDSVLMDPRRGVVTSNGGGVAKAFAYLLLGDFQSDVVPPPEQQLANVDTLVNNLARSLTNMVREGNTRLNATDASAVVTGTVFTAQPRVAIQYKWLAMLAAQLVLTGVFLGVTVAVSRMEGVQVLKGSSLAGLVALDSRAREQMGGIDGLDGLGKRAKGMKLRMERGEDGRVWLRGRDVPM